MDTNKVWQLKIDPRQRESFRNNMGITVVGPKLDGDIHVIELKDYEAVKNEAVRNRSDAEILADQLRNTLSVLLIGILKNNVTALLAKFDNGEPL